MRKILNIVAGIVLTGLAFATCLAQDDEPLGYTYATYYVCDVATQGDMDDIVEANEKPVFDKWVEDGKLIGWGYLAHNTGGRWRRLQYHVSPTLADALKTQAAIFTEIYEDNDEAGQARSQACQAHDDYIWAFEQGSGPGTERGDSSLSVYFVCDIPREDRADEIVSDVIAPRLRVLQEEGKIASWGWSSHVIGGRYRRLQTMTGADHASVLNARGELLQYMNEDHSALADEFSDICGSHSDYLWDIVHEPA